MVKNRQGILNALDPTTVCKRYEVSYGTGAGSGAFKYFWSYRQAKKFFDKKTNESYSVSLIDWFTKAPEGWENKRMSSGGTVPVLHRFPPAGKKKNPDCVHKWDHPYMAKWFCRKCFAEYNWMCGHGGSAYICNPCYDAFIKENSPVEEFLKKESW